MADQPEQIADLAHVSPRALNIRSPPPMAFAVRARYKGGDQTEFPCKSLALSAADLAT